MSTYERDRLDVEGDIVHLRDAGAVRFDKAQTLTEAQKAAARENIGVTSGGGGVEDYDDLENRPSINGHTLTGNQTGAALGLVDASQVGAAGGVAELDSGGRVPVSELPYMVDTSANWAVRTAFVPPAGMMIVYTDKDTMDDGGVTKNIAGIKVGDGNAYVVDLPFITDLIGDTLRDHAGDEVRHITSAERTFWNNKLNALAVGENLHFNRN